MNDTYIVTVYVVLDDLLRVLRYHDDRRAELSAAEILTVAVVAAKYFQNHHERALYLLVQLGYLRAFSVSRFNRRLHALSEWLWHVAGILGEVFAKGKVFIVDTLPIPLCKRVRAKRCRKVQGLHRGYAAHSPLQTRAGQALPQGARTSVQGLLCSQTRALFRLAIAPGLRCCGCTGHF